MRARFGADQRRSTFGAACGSAPAWKPARLLSGIVETDHSASAECLVPQIYSARRFGYDLSRRPRLIETDATCHTLPEFAAAHPSEQADSES